jgi:hypothetical protein
MGGFLGIGGVNSKQQNQSIGNLNNLFSYGFGQGQSNVAAGNQSLGQAGSYYSSLLSGNRSALQTAMAPETNQVRSAADAQRKQQASMGTARGGGVAGANQTQQDQTNAQIDNAIFAARPAAAQGAANVGAATAGIGENLLATGGTATAAAGDIATKARQQAAQEQASAIQAGIGLIFG